MQQAGAVLLLACAYIACRDGLLSVRDGNAAAAAAAEAPGAAPTAFPRGITLLPPKEAPGAPPAAAAAAAAAAIPAFRALPPPRLSISFCAS
jgi:hypothetical protein